MSQDDAKPLPAPVPCNTWQGQLKPCKCGADVWKYRDDHDNGDWVEASYQCGHCGKIIYVELPD